jgi:hypothetical protein
MTALCSRRFVLTGFVLCLAVLATGQVSVTTYYNDNSRTGQNVKETVLNPSNVNSTQFGKLFSTAVDGFVYAQPLYVPNVKNIAGGTHNVLYVATEHDSLYAINADSGVVLWKKSFIDPAAGITTVPNTDVSCANLKPEIGITATPVIDTKTSTIYLVAETKENGLYKQRLHAIDITSKAEKFGGPKVISATVNGTGNGSADGKVSFNPLREQTRPGLLLQNGHVVIAWTSHCDIGPYHGWVMSYSASTLAQEAVFNTSPNGEQGGIWMSGDGVAADASGSLYLVTGNGTYDGATHLSFGDSIVKLSGPSGGTFKVVDWFTPHNQASLDGGDTDLGSGGVLLLPNLPDGSAHPHLLVQMGKEGTVYLIDRDNMGKFCSGCGSNPQIVQEIPGASAGIWGSPAYWNGSVYWGGGKEGNNPDHLKAFSFNANNSGVLSASPTSESQKLFLYSTAAPVVSSNGNTKGILWILDNSSYKASCCQVLYAFDATNLATMLYNSNQAANNRDQSGGAVKFTAPIVANGKVYAGSQKRVTAWGLTGSTPAAQHEAESLPFSGSPNAHLVAWSEFSGSKGVISDGTAVGAHLQFTINVGQAGTYDVRYATKQFPNRAIVQLSVNGVNAGSPQDEYNASGAGTLKEYDLGAVTFSTAGNYGFNFTATGHNASSSGYTVVVDYIKLTRQ